MYTWDLLHLLRKPRNKTRLPHRARTYREIKCGKRKVERERETVRKEKKKRRQWASENEANQPMPRDRQTRWQHKEKKLK